MVSEAVIATEAIPSPRIRKSAKTPEVSPSPAPEIEVLTAAPKAPLRRKTSLKKSTAPEAIKTMAEAVEAEIQPARKPRRASENAPKSVVKSEELIINAVPSENGVFPEELPIVQWRARSEKPAQQTKPATKSGLITSVETEAKVDPQEGFNKRRRRRRKGGKDSEVLAESIPSGADDETADETAPAVAEDQALPKTIFRNRKIEIPLTPVHDPIEIPAEAPQVVMRNGIPTIVRNHRVYPPLIFFGSPADERKANTVLDELRLAAEAGIHLHSHLIELEVDPQAVDTAVSFAAYMLSRSVEIDPESQVIFRVVFHAPRNWHDRFPESRYKTADGTVSEPSLCDDGFWKVASNCLETFTKKLRLLDQKDSIMGVHLERGEWFFASGWGYDNSKAAVTKFREWSRKRYGNDEVALRASWFDGGVRFDNITVPEYQPEGAEGDKFVRSSRKQRRYVDYHLFLSDITVFRIAELAYVAKSASDGMFLVGASYGYTFEWSHPSNGHLALGKLLRTPEVDFIAGPPSYHNREPGGSAPFPGPIDSFALNGKLYISEDDFKTSLSQGHEPDDFNPVIKTPQALESIHWRGAGAAIAHGAGAAWMDLWGNGWLRTHSVWERAAAIRKAMITRMEVPLSDPEVAVFIDERALAYLVDQNAFTLLVQNVREAILRAGVSAAFYLLSDLAHREKFPESRLYLFLNSWDIRPDLRAAIKSRLQRDNKVLFWLYSAGLFDAGRESLERAREVTGIALKPQPFYSKAGTTILNRRHTLCEAFPDRMITSAKQLEPSYFAIPEDAVVLGEYTQTGLPSFVVKEFREADASQQWTSVFLGEPLVNPALIRSLAQMAGAHVFNFHDDVVHVRPPFLTVHCSGSGPRTITLPNKWAAYSLLTGQWASVESTNLRFTAIDGSTHVFLVGPRTELEHLISLDPNEVLHMENLPPRELNLLHDISNFDVPIMKLDEWIEGGDTDDAADEWFLRPPEIQEEAPETATESSEKIGRRRRRRRGGRGNERSSSDEIGGSRSEVAGTPVTNFEDTGFNVVFRKRE